MKKFYLAIILILSAHSYGICQPAYTDFEITESVPLETVLGSSYTARTAQVWAAMISRARRSVDIEQFYLTNRNGSAFDSVITEIKRAAARGVKIRILLDAMFYKKTPEDADLLKSTIGVEVKTIAFDKLAGGVMHAKFFIVDGEEFFVGSQNFDWRSIDHTHEVGARIKNKKLADSFTAIFERDWARASKAGRPFPAQAAETSATAGNPAELKFQGETVFVYPAFSPPGMPAGLDWELAELLKIINSSKIELNIQVMSYSTAKKGGRWTELQDALIQAAGRDVKIKIILADWTINEKSAGALKRLAQTEGIMLKISSIPRHSSGFIEYARVEHCKYMVADDAYSWIGTGNWEYGYFYNSRNAALVIRGKKPAAVLKDIFNISWNGPYVSPFNPAADYKPVRRTKNSI